VIFYATMAYLNND